MQVCATAILNQLYTQTTYLVNTVETILTWTAFFIQSVTFIILSLCACERAVFYYSPGHMGHSFWRGVNQLRCLLVATLLITCKCRKTHIHVEQTVNTTDKIPVSMLVHSHGPLKYINLIFNFKFS